MPTKTQLLRERVRSYLAAFGPFTARELSLVLGARITDVHRALCCGWFVALPAPAHRRYDLTAEGRAGVPRDGAKMLQTGIRPDAPAA